jgi:beta-lactamase regulating signal transducer with metallopeptidase domain
VFSWLVYNTLCALPLALVALLLRRWLSPGLEHALWLCVLVRLVLPPLPGLDGTSAAPAASSLVVATEPGVGDVVVARLTRAFGPQWSVHGARIALVAFLLILVFVLWREVQRAWRVERCVRSSRGAPRELARYVAGVARALGVRAPRVRVSGLAGGPFLWSLRRPVLVLPDGGRPAPTVLAHEFAHLSRRDHWTAWLELVVAGFHFWNPLFWLARRRLRLCAELSCDRWVVERFPGERRAFAAALVDAAERASEAPFVPRAVQAIGADARDFEERLQEILHREVRKTPRALLAVGLGLSLLTLPPWALPSLAQFRRALPEIPRGIDGGVWAEELAEADARLDADPEALAALVQRGIALAGLGRRDEALRVFEEQERLGFQPAKAAYNQACLHALEGRPERAVECLERAGFLGLDVQLYAEQDPDLAELREHPVFVERIGER